VVSPLAKRRAIWEVVERGLGTTAQACRAMGLGRSSFYLESCESSERKALKQRIVALSHEHPRYGYRRITAMLRKEGRQLNPKRVQRVRRQVGLQVVKKQRRMRRLGVSTAKRQQALRPNHVWSWDFVEDQTEHGSRFRILTLIDEYTRECLAVHVAWSIRAVDVVTVVEAAMEQYGVPEHLRSDNGPEFIAYAIADWVEEREIKTIYITPGSPWEQAYIESFHDKFRDECLNREIFGSLLEAQVVIGQWRVEYNTERPHSSLRYQTPEEFAARTNSPGRQSGSALLPSRTIAKQINTKPNAELYF